MKTANPNEALYVIFKLDFRNEFPFYALLWHNLTLRVFWFEQQQERLS